MPIQSDDTYDFYSAPSFDYNFGYIPPAFRSGADGGTPGGGILKRTYSQGSSINEMEENERRPVLKKLKGNEDLHKLSVNTIRVLSAEMVQKANSGHPGAPMGCAPMAHVLFGLVMRHDATNPAWPNRDRFVLSNGHACALLYSMLHLSGYEVTMDDLKGFRQLNSKTPGHPENFHTVGVEVSTGPLGQGLSNAVGLAMAQANMAATFNKEGFTVSDNYTFVICGDGCLQEGVTSEACSLAGHLGLGRLIVLYDDNNITIDGSTDLSFTENVLKRFESYGWHTLVVADGDNDVEAIASAIARAKSIRDKPSLIKVHTTIGFGSAKAGSASVHGAPIGEADIIEMKKKIAFPADEPFVIPPDVATFYKKRKAEGRCVARQWEALMESYEVEYPELAEEFQRRQRCELPSNWEAMLPKFSSSDPTVATRQSSNMCLNAIAPVIPEMIGGSADLTPSNLTKFKGAVDFQRDTPEGRYIRFGVREHAMSAICNGIAAFGCGYIPFCATFLNFAGYALGAMRMSALSKFGVIYVMTHDSIGLGEDGPTHQPVEMLVTLRSIPNMLVMRPADSQEVSGAYAVAIKNRARPTVLALSRQGCPNLVGCSDQKVAFGAYVIHEPEAKAQLILVASGSEVNLCESVAKQLAPDLQVRVVSMPCWELYEEQSNEYKRSVFLSGVPVLAVEAATPVGWDKYAHATQTMNSYGASGSGKDLLKHFGFSAECVISKAKKLVEFYQSHPLPSKTDFPDI